VGTLKVSLLEKSFSSKDRHVFDQARRSGSRSTTVRVLGIESCGDDDGDDDDDDGG
jgi:hypothetical protein